ncbi:TonB-dependent receptor plug domain-containing protein [Flavobacterium terrae]|uniref:TonB-dependent Receptor Plug Domain n=1 Tax=Flavobacterium terrae TaxID=415425 RepID=A0A1M6D094_9FLAO|nr:TonB-dependent receptor plug domain-containing protein [Flavobacterium terrae]SHI66630.1 TonB-dependent Receptor Plug Domain [Flavobacterium terrae]
MKSVKLFSLAITMFFSIITFGQEKRDSILNVKRDNVRFCTPNNKNLALIVIDGHFANAKLVEMINPNDIKSVEVLKRDKAKAKYGEKAENGIIIITSKLSRRKLKKLLKQTEIKNI